jgi:hypothetical protein
MADDRNSKLVALLAGPTKRPTPRPRPLCADCGDVAGEGIDCEACQSLRAARHGRSSEEEQLYQKAKRTRSLDDRSAEDWRRGGPTSLPRPDDEDEDDDEKPGAGSIETDAPAHQAGEGGVTPTPALHSPVPGEPAGEDQHSTPGEHTGETRKGIEMAARLPKGKVPPLRAAEPPRAGAKRCENPRSNPKCAGMSVGRLCRSCGILEARLARGPHRPGAVPPAAPAAKDLPTSPPAVEAAPGRVSEAVTSAICRERVRQSLAQALAVAGQDNPCWPALSRCLRWIEAEAALAELGL